MRFSLYFRDAGAAAVVALYYRYIQLRKLAAHFAVLFITRHTRSAFATSNAVTWGLIRPLRITKAATLKIGIALSLVVVYYAEEY